MIVIAKENYQKSLNRKSIPSFEELLPAIRKQARRAFRTYKKDARQELIAEVIANSFRAYRRLVQRGKGDLIYATPLANYAIKQVIAGRRIGTPVNANDISSEWCQQKKNVKVERLDRYDCENNQWREVVVQDRHSTPADIACTRIDFSSWLKSLSPRIRKIAKLLATGETNKNAAKRFDVSSGRISQLRTDLKNSWTLFQSEPTAV